MIGRELCFFLLTLFLAVHLLFNDDSFSSALGTALNCTALASTVTMVMFHAVYSHLYHLACQAWTGFLIWNSTPEGEIMRIYLAALVLLMMAIPLWQWFCRRSPIPLVKLKPPKTRKKLPGFAACGFHRSFHYRFKRVGYFTLFYSPPRVCRRIWQPSWKFWKPGWTFRPRKQSFGIWKTVKIDDEPVQTPRKLWDDPITPVKLSASDFCKPCEVAACLNSNLDASVASQDTETTAEMSCDLEPDIPPLTNIPKWINVNTLRGRRSARRLRKKKHKIKTRQPSRTVEFNCCGPPTSTAELAELYNVSGGRFQTSDDLFQLVWDTGASHCITFCKEDFSSAINFYSQPRYASGLAKGLKILGEGTVEWKLQLNDGTTSVISLGAYYIPDCNRRLLCPQQLLKTLRETDQASQCRVELTATRLTFHRGRHQIYVDYDATNNLPISYGSNPTSEALEMNVAELNECLTASYNANLTKAQKELLRCHFMFGHMSMRRIQETLKTGALARNQDERARHLAAARVEDLPKCAACAFAKAKKKPLPGQHQTKENTESTGNVKKDKLLPGQCVAVDHFTCSSKGRLFTSAGKTAPSSMYCGAALFTDMATGLMHAEFQTTFDTAQTLHATHRFEAKMRDMGIHVQSYRADNGSAFTSAQFQADLARKSQDMTRSGRGVHSQNGVAERAIQTVTSIARTMMIHSAIHWPAVADSSLWPMALQHAIYLHNRFPLKGVGHSPYELATYQRFERRKLMDVHVWGAPAYVLDPRIQDGKKIPRWTPRSRRGMYMGISPFHASTIPLILNLVTHRITGQYHCVFDDWFSTVDMNPDDVPDFESDQWTHLFANQRFVYDFDPTDGPPPALDTDYQDQQYSNTMRNHDVQPHPSTQSQSFGGREAQQQQETQAPAPPNASSPTATAQTPAPAPPPPPAQPTEQREQREQRELNTPTSPQQTATQEIDPDAVTVQASNVSPRRPRRSPRLTPQQDTSLSSRPRRAYAGAWKSVKFHDEQFDKQANLFWMTPDPTPLGLEFVVEACAASAKTDPDTLSWWEAMRDKDAQQFKQSATTEITALHKHDTWKLVDRSKATDKILPGTWVFRRKRNPGTGAIIKYKGRYAVRGDLQKGVFDTFAPVVQWSTVRMLMMIALRYGYHTRCIDFSSAFVQAKLDKPVWIDLPKGDYPELFGENTTGKCLELKKSLYGLSVAPKLWYQHLRDRLIERKFKPSKMDPCLFYRNNIAIAIYVDDMFMIGKHQKELQEIINELSQEFTVTDEGTLSTYLGIAVKRTNNQFCLSQPALTQKVIDAAGMHDCGTDGRPASEVLHASKDKAPHNAQWEYASIIGMLMYLANNSRPDIAFAVNQCARFTHDPREPHTVAVKKIIRYLQGTKDKGLFMTTTVEPKVDCYADADFAGAYRKDADLQDPTTAKSRTGYIIYVHGVPVTWGSRLQTEIALSSVEAEYVCLSTACRELLGLRALLQELGENLHITKNFKFTAKSIVFEDNNGAIAQAKSPTMTPRSKHYATKYHFFKSHCKPKGCIELKPIDTAAQAADIFTKPLQAQSFERIRKLVMGW